MNNNEGEGSPFLEESEDSKLHGIYIAYWDLTTNLNYSHNDALQAMGVTEEKLQEVLRLYSDKDKK
jgi:hypothetical protein